MKHIIAIIMLMMAVFNCHTAMAQSSRWKSYMSYHDVQDVIEAGNTLYVLASNSLFSYNKNDKSITTYDKATSLTDCEISKIAWNNTAKKLIILYSNYNIDIMDDDGYVTNISSYQNYSTTYDKKVNDIYISGKYAYLSTGFGVIKLNVADNEISDTYTLGFNVNWCSIADGKINAYSNQQGHYQAILTDNLLDKGNWKRVGNYIAKNIDDKTELITSMSELNVGGPKYNHFGFMKFYNGKLYTCPGGFGSVDLARPGAVQVLNNNDWQIYQDGLTNTTGIEYIDINCIAVDPKNLNHVFAGGRTGLYEFNNGIFTKLYNQDNSPLESAVNDNSKNYVLVQGMAFDNRGNLWVLNSQAKTQSILQLSGNTWTSYKHPELMKLNGSNRSLGNMIHPFFDNSGYMWFANDNWQLPSFYRYNPSNDNINAYTKFINEDGTALDIKNVRSINEDKDGNIWVGTTAGPLYLQPSDFTSTDPIMQQYKVPRNDGTNLADYLLGGVDISAMAIDAAGRKWIGTYNNGVFLISRDNNTQIHHFLAEDSKLLSNYIESIAINSETGEVYFGTDKGLCSYMEGQVSDVDEMNEDNTYAYPNPVKPGYTGPITITGLTENADVKIVTVNGVLVNEGKANAGTYVWYGKDLKGNRVASGIYMVQTATAEGESGTVCKIAIIN